MITRQTITDAVQQMIAGSDIFVVDVEITANNDIDIVLDSPGPFDIDKCAEINRGLREQFAPEIDDYSIQVGSAGITTPLRVVAQYTKNLGHDVEVLTRDGRKLTGTLVAVDGETSTFTIEVPTKVKKPDQKRPVVEQVPQTLAMDQCKSVTPVLKFK